MASRRRSTSKWSWTRALPRLPKFFSGNWNSVSKYLLKLCEARHALAEIGSVQKQLADVEQKLGEQNLGEQNPSLKSAVANARSGIAENASAASYFPVAAHANTSIFYDRATGAPANSQTCATYQLTARYDVALPSQPICRPVQFTPSRYSHQPIFHQPRAPRHLPEWEHLKVCNWFYAQLRVCRVWLPRAAAVVRKLRADAGRRRGS